DLREAARDRLRAAVRRSVVDDDHPRPDALLGEDRVQGPEHGRRAVVVHHYDKDVSTCPPASSIDNAVRLALVTGTLHAVLTIGCYTRLDAKRMPCWPEN